MYLVVPFDVVAPRFEPVVGGDKPHLKEEGRKEEGGRMKDEGGRMNDEG